MAAKPTKPNARLAAVMRGKSLPKQRGVTKPGFQIGSRKTSPVPGMSRTKAAINSLTKKGQAENQSRIDAMYSSNHQPRIGGTGIAAAGRIGGDFLDQTK